MIFSTIRPERGFQIYTLDFNRSPVSSRFHHAAEKDGDIGDVALFEDWGVLCPLAGLYVIRAPCNLDSSMAVLNLNMTVK